MFMYSHKFFLILSNLIILLTLSACASRAVLVDFDKNTDFEQLKTYYIYSVSHDDQIGAERLVDHAQRLLENKGALIADAEYVDASVEIEHFIEEQEKESRLSIGLGTGSFGRSGSIGVGGSVNLPLSSDAILFAVVRLKVIVKNKVVWQGNQRIEVENGVAESMGLAQTIALSDILAEYPLNKKN